MHVLLAATSSSNPSRCYNHSSLQLKDHIFKLFFAVAFEKILDIVNACDLSGQFRDNVTVNVL